VFISSESALHIPPEMIHYGFSKTAQLAISRGVGELTMGTGVTVNAVLPGPTRSDGVETFLQAMAQKDGVSTDEMAAGFVKQHRPTSLLQRFASVEEVANMVIYACSMQASATNGAALRVEGGIVRTIT
jgi:NAD(P)-dependent dehydrogenase (short-subunit alcohol dehydrogenase family)